MAVWPFSSWGGVPLIYRTARTSLFERSHSILPAGPDPPPPAAGRTAQSWEHGAPLGAIAPYPVWYDGGYAAREYARVFIFFFCAT